MKVAELIEALKGHPPELEVVMWDDETQVIDRLASADAVTLGPFGDRLTLSGEGAPALLLLNASQGLDSIRATVAEMEGILADLDGRGGQLHDQRLFGAGGVCCDGEEKG